METLPKLTKVGVNANLKLSHALIQFSPDRVHLSTYHGAEDDAHEYDHRGQACGQQGG